MSLINNITVITPVYNAAAYLERAVESALAQPETAEIILIEDCSPDNSLEVCEKLAERYPKVKLYTHPGNVNKGAGASRNVGIRNAQFPYIAFLDADDFFLPDRFSAEREIFQNNTDADGVYGAIGVHYYDDDAEQLFKRVHNHELTTIRKILPPEEVVYSLLDIRGFGHFSLDALTIKKSVFIENNLYFNEDLRLHQDTDLLIKLSYHSRLYPGSITAAVTNRGVHGHNRITAIPNVKAKNHNAGLMWNSLFKWCEERKISDDLIRTEITLQYYSHLIMTEESSFSRWLIWYKLVRRDKRLFLNNRYFYLYEKYLLTNTLTKKICNKIRHIYAYRVG